MGTWRWHIEKQYLHERLKDALLWNKSVEMYRDKQQWWYMSKQLEGNVYCCNTAGGMITNSFQWAMVVSLRRWLIHTSTRRTWLCLCMIQIECVWHVNQWWLKQWLQKKGNYWGRCGFFGNLTGWSPSILSRFWSFLVQIARFIQANFGSNMALFAVSVVMECNVKLWRAIVHDDTTQLTGRICTLMASFFFSIESITDTDNDSMNEPQNSDQI